MNDGFNILQLKQIHEYRASFAVKPMERQYRDGVAGAGQCLVNVARVDNIRKGKDSDVKLMDTSGIGQYPSCGNRREGISLDEVEWEIPWEDLQIGGRIGIGKNIPVSIFCKTYC